MVLPDSGGDLLGDVQRAESMLQATMRSTPVHQVNLTKLVDRPETLHRGVVQDG